jgi:hypothetical protein
MNTASILSDYSLYTTFILYEWCPGSCLNTAYILPVYCLNTVWIQPICCMNTPPIFPHYCLKTVWLTPEYVLPKPYPDTTSVLPEYVLITAWILSEYCLDTAQILLEYFLNKPIQRDASSLSILRVPCWWHICTKSFWFILSFTVFRTKLMPEIGADIFSAVLNDQQYSVLSDQQDPRLKILFLGGGESSGSIRSVYIDCIQSFSR